MKFFIKLIIIQSIALLNLCLEHLLIIWAQKNYDIFVLPIYHTIIYILGGIIISFLIKEWESVSKAIKKATYILSIFHFCFTCFWTISRTNTSTLLLILVGVYLYFIFFSKTKLSKYWITFIVYKLIIAFKQKNSFSQKFKFLYSLATSNYSMLTIEGIIILLTKN